MADQEELARRELQLEWEIARHELERLADDDARIDQIEEKLAECQLIMARQDDMARRDALRREYALDPVQDHPGRTTTRL